MPQLQELYMSIKLIKLFYSPAVFNVDISQVIILKVLIIIINLVFCPHTKHVCTPIVQIIHTFSYHC